jgi:hypothetical protein
MTAGVFADLVQAQHIGEGRWKARCPAHNDRSPSLSIRAGDDGRVLVLCRAGCALDSILSALKLARRDLFAGPPPSPQQAYALRASLGARQEAARAERKARLAALDRVEKLEEVVHRLGAKLARAPENDALAGLFDGALKRLHDAVTEADNFYPVRRVSAQDKDATGGQASV